jgi:4-amino-4-deoxy-L-arabinose transferase-like glycosyltransferase
MSVITRPIDRRESRLDSPPTFPPGRPQGRSRRITPARAGLAALLVLTAIAYLWNLSRSGDANSFYAAAVQAGTKSWKAFLFGSIDSSNFITVDKPPASLWVMELSGRLFGFSSWSMLVPQALEGVGSVWLLYAAVRRWFGSAAGLTAGAVLALTPVAALMFRFNNPDALLVMLMVAAAYCLTRALERGGTRWLVGCGVLLGFAFLTKMLQAFLVLPAFVLVYLVAAPVPVRRRVGQLLAGGVALLASAGWWVALVALWPAGSRPYIDGSQDNSIFNLIFGYNGLERVFSSGGGGGAGGNFSGQTGLLRLFNDLMGAQASWLLPAALAALAAGVWATRRAPRTDRTRAALLLWGGWLIVTAVVFSFGSGIIHTYYTVALAPAIAALVAIGASLAWERRASLTARAIAAAAILGSAVWAFVLLGRDPSWEPWLRPLVLTCGGLSSAGLLAASARHDVRRRLFAAAAVLGSVAMLAGPAAYAAQTISTAHTGSIPSAGPASAGGFGGIGGGGGARPSARSGGGFPGSGSSTRSGGGFPGSGSSTRSGGGFPGSGSSTRSGGRFPGSGSSTRSGGRFPGSGSGTRSSGGVPGSGSAKRGSAGGPGAGSGGGPGGATTISSALKTALARDASHYRWVAATSGSENAASIELATGGLPVMAIGGFNGNGGDLTLAQFERYVKAGEVHYYIAGGGAGGGQGSTSAITSWVESHYRSVTIGGETLYDLTQAVK